MSSCSNADSILANNLLVAVMEEPKRCRPEQASCKTDKEPKLPPECRIPVFKFLPTSELVRFVSKSLSLLGEYWSHDLKFVVEQRLPFGVYLNPDSILIAPQEEPMIEKFALCDCLTNKIADIKHPELFQLSPLSELTEHVHLPAKFHGIDSPLGALLGKELLASLTNLRSLKLSFGPFHEPPGCSELLLDFPSLSPDIQQTLSQVDSLQLSRNPLYAFSFNTHLLHCFESLKWLEVGVVEFFDVMPVMVPFKRFFEFWALPHHGAEMLTRLEPLHIARMNDSGAIVNLLPMRPILHFLGITCVQLSELSLPLDGEISHYMPVFRAMPNLVKLALDVHSLESNGLIEHEGPSATVKDLSITGWCSVANQQAMLMAVLAKFPNVRSFSLKVGSVYEILQLAADVLSRRLFPCLNLLKCIPNGAAHTPRELQQLLKHSNLPLRVLILPSDSSAFVAKDPDFLVSLYGIMKSNPAQFLLMKGPLHPQALVRLEEVLLVDRKVMKMTKVIAWTDKDLPTQRGIECRPPLDLPDFTDVKTTGVKTAGPKNGEEFTIRICHQHTDIISYIV